MCVIGLTSILFRYLCFSSHSVHISIHVQVHLYSELPDNVYIFPADEIETAVQGSLSGPNIFYFMYISFEQHFGLDGVHNYIIFISFLRIRTQWRSSMSQWCWAL